MSDEALNTGGGISSTASAPADSAPAESSSPAAETSIDSIFDEVTASLEGAAPSESVSEETAPASEPAPATEAQPAQTPPETPPPPSPGEPPKERWDTILKNAREKERAAVLEHVVQQYGEPLRVVEALRSDPVGTVVQLMTELQGDPRFAQQMASHAARTLRAARGAADPMSDEPQPDLDAGNGVLLYSAGQMAKREAWLRNQLQQEFQQQWQQAVAPLQQDWQARQEQQRKTAEATKAMAAANQRISSWIDRPHFKEHKDEIRVKQAEYHAAGMDTWDALAAAYADVLTTKVVPSQLANREQHMVAQAAQKLRAATANPSATAAAAPRKASSIDDAFDLALGELTR